jgi:tryptophanyl-tRNA synthetase
MSKSYDNCLYITDSAGVIWDKIKTMVTDPQRARRKDPGNPDVCPVYDLHRVFTSAEERLLIETGCRTAGIGCMDCKSILCEGIERVLGPAREKRSEIESNPEKLDSILEQGAKKARIEARKTIRLVRDAMLLPGKPNHLDPHS